MKELGLIALESADQMGTRIDRILSEWHDGRHFRIPSECIRFASGEGKGMIYDSVREMDLYILVDVCNSSLTYKMNGFENHMSPDDHFQDLKRMIAACGGTADRITVIMPFLYEGRQHRKTNRESLDCAHMLRELENMGIHSLITFDAHDPRIQNVVPMMDFLNVSPALQFTESLLAEYQDLQLDGEHMMFISPDEGATERVVFMASVFGVNIGMFFKRRDYTHIINGTNPIIAHEFCGGSVEGMDVIIVDDMIASGGSVLDVSKQLKLRGAKRVIIFTTFGLFSNGLDAFDDAYEQGVFDRIFTTNLVYQAPELLKRKYYRSVEMESYVAAMIDHKHHGGSLLDLTRPQARIRQLIEEYRK